MTAFASCWFVSRARLLAPAAVLATALAAALLTGCSQPVEVGDASSASTEQEAGDASAAAGEDLPYATDEPISEEPILDEPGAEEIAAPEPTFPPSDAPPAGLPAAEPDPEPARGPGGLVASPDNLDAFFGGGGSTPAADDRYSADTPPPASPQPSDKPALWKSDADAGEPDQSVADFFGDMMDDPPAAQDDPAPPAEAPLAGLPMAEEPAVPSEDQTEQPADSPDALGAFLAPPAVDEEPAAEPPPAEAPAAPPSDGFPFVDMPAEPPAQPTVEPEAEDTDTLPPIDFLPLADPPADDPPADDVQPQESVLPPADDILPDWSPDRPSIEEPTAEAEQPSMEPLPEAMPEPEPTTLPPPSLPREPGDPLPPPIEQRIPPKRPTPNMNNTRQLAWLLGAKLGLTTAGDSAPKPWELQGLSETLGIEPVDIDASGDAAQVTSRLLKASGTLGKRLARQHGSDHAALLEIAVKSNALATLIGDHPKLAAPVATAIEQAAERSGLDPELMRPLVQTLRSNPTPEEAREAVFQLHDAVAAELDSEG